MTKTILFLLLILVLTPAACVVLRRALTKVLTAIILWCRPDPDDRLRFVLRRAGPSFRNTPVSERLRPLAVQNPVRVDWLIALLAVGCLVPGMPQWIGLDSRPSPFPAGVLHGISAALFGLVALVAGYAQAIGHVARAVLLQRFPDSPAARGEPADVLFEGMLP